MYDEQVSIMESVLDVDDLIAAVRQIRQITSAILGGSEECRDPYSGWGQQAKTAAPLSRGYR